MNFPSDPCFDALNTDLKAPTARWGVFGAHDPSLFEEEGRFFAYSTGTFGENAYQIRTSRDLIHWQFVKQAFPHGLQSIRPAVSQVLELLGRRSKNETLWAPDVIRGKDGKYWLYGCYSAVFGDNYSVIFLARADAPAVSRTPRTRHTPAPRRRKRPRRRAYKDGSAPSCLL